MKKILNYANTCVYDDFITEHEFNELNSWFNRLPFVFKQTQGEWNKSWSTTDGNILISKQINLPSTCIIDVTSDDQPLMPWLKSLHSALNNSFLDMSQVDSIALTPYVWPPGVGLSWHNDSKYVGAFTYYVHKKWESNWSGEFLTVEADQFIDRPKDLKWQVFNNDELDKLIVDHGIGNFIIPKPNRLVINRAGENGILHKVNKSTAQAKDRLTLQGFLLKHG
jgi:hypothetical protein